jgi:acyl carrier protein
MKTKHHSEWRRSIMAEKLTKAQIEEKVKKVVCDQLQVEASEVNADSLFVDDLGADSLDLTELAVAFEDEFELEIPEADFGQLSTVAGVVDYIDGRLA